ncbi:MAG: hypothetical protein R6V19_17135 [Armatimonadota bacterium]
MSTDPALKLYRLSRLRTAQNKTDVAIEYARQGLQIVQEASLRWKLRDALATALQQQGRTDEAVDQYAQNAREGAPSELAEDCIKKIRRNDASDHPVAVNGSDSPVESATVPPIAGQDRVPEEHIHTAPESGRDAETAEAKREVPPRRERSIGERLSPLPVAIATAVCVIAIIGYTAHIRAIDAFRTRTQSGAEPASKKAASRDGQVHLDEPRQQVPSRASSTPQSPTGSRKIRIKRLFHEAVESEEHGISFPTEYADRDLISFFWRTPVTKTSYAAFKQRWPHIKRALAYVPAYGIDDDDTVQVWPLRADSQQIPRGAKWNRATHLGLMVTRVDPWDEASRLWVIPLER